MKDFVFSTLCLTIHATKTSFKLTRPANQLYKMSSLQGQTRQEVNERKKTCCKDLISAERSLKDSGGELNHAI